MSYKKTGEIKTVFVKVSISVFFLLHIIKDNQEKVYKKRGFRRIST